MNNQNLEDVWKPAAEQFSGSGSYGNGGAMRVSPVALFAFKNYDSLIQIAEQTTRLTHTHPLGINGAILQVWLLSHIVYIYKLQCKIIFWGINLNSTYEGWQRIQYSIYRGNIN